VELAGQRLGATANASLESPHVLLGPLGPLERTEVVGQVRAQCDGMRFEDAGRPRVVLRTAGAPAARTVVGDLSAERGGAQRAGDLALERVVVGRVRRR